MIFTASQSYIWDNVYQYDREFRMHISKYPERSWAIILQQAWTMYLKNKISVNSHFDYSNRQGGFTPGSGTPKSKKDVCKRFNKGLCSRGRGCRYVHHCLECSKFGHGAHICRRRLNTEGETSSNRASSTGSSGSATK